MLSIITPVLNGSAFIEKNIKSIQQLKIPFEHIIVDGGSTDDTLKIISMYPKIKLLVQKEKNGMYGAIHDGVLSSKGDYLAYVNADDEIISNGYEKMYKQINKSKIDVVYSNALLKFEISNKHILSKGNRYAKFFLKKGIFPFIQPSSIFSKSAYFKIGGLSYDKYRICGDFDFFYRLALTPNSKLSYCNITSSIFLISNNSLGSLNSEIGLQEKKRNGIPVTISFMMRILFKITNFF